jgi:membrane-associated phospholipid phosphatase
MPSFLVVVLLHCCEVPDDPRHCIIESMNIIVTGRPPIGMISFASHKIIFDCQTILSSILRHLTLLVVRIKLVLNPFDPELAKKPYTIKEVSQSFPSTHSIISLSFALSIISII